MANTQKVKPLEIYFDNRAGTYWMRSGARFLSLDGRNIKLHLMRSGMRVDTEDEHGLRDGDRVLTNAQLERAIDYAGPLAGHDAGLLPLSDGSKALVTSQVAPVEAKAGKCPTLIRFLNQLLVDDEQTGFFMFWLKMGLESVRKRDFRPGQLLVLAGPSGCGKSFLQALITEVFGGRSAKPYRYMIGDTAFNSDLAAAEHLVIEDENSSADIRSRRAFGAAIKQFTVNRDMSVHAKGRQAITLPTFHRLTLSVNQEPENLMILPPMDSSLLDNVMLFKCQPAELSEDREKNWQVFTGELPAFVAHVRSLRIPAGLRCPRFGVVAFHHPEILEVITQISPEQRLLNLIDEILFTRRQSEDWKAFTERTKEPWEGSAEELEKVLRAPDSGFGFAVDKLLYFSSACGVYLSRLANKSPGRFVMSKNKGRTVWTIGKGDAK